MPKRIDMVGNRYGRVLVISDRNKDGVLLGTPGYRLVVIRCDCGSTKTVSGRGLRKGHTKSCGCLHGEVVTKHGYGSHHLAPVWRSMIARCHNPKSSSFRNYGGRGIKVCQEWRSSIETFIAWAESSNWEKGLHIDRIDNDKGYCPDNCRFVDVATNQNNRRSNRKIVVSGMEMTIAEASVYYEVPYDKLYQRIHKLGWSASRAVE